MNPPLTAGHIQAALPGCEPRERLAGYHNDVWLVRHRDADRILRISPPGHRTREELHAELAFLSCLIDSGAPVVRPVTAAGENGVITLEHPDQRLACLFEQADGSSWRDCEHDATVIEAAGDALGRIHAASRELGAGSRRDSAGAGGSGEANAARHVREVIRARRQWHEKPHLVRAPEACDRIRAGLGRRITEFIAGLRAHDGGTGWGLLHGDYLFSNYLVTESGVCVIDFDDCEWGHYTYDVATNVYYYVLGGDPAGAESRTERARELLEQFFRGYRRHQPFGRAEAELAEALMVQREIDLLSSIATHFDLEELGPWQEAFVETSVPRIMEHRPVVSLAASGRSGRR